MADLLVVVRAGTTEYDLQGRIRGNLDMPLTAAGRSAAVASARELAAAPPTALYSSPSASATATAAVIGSALGLAPRRVAALADLDLGLWQGMLVDDIRRRQPRLARHWEEDPWTVVPPDGEPLADARDRVAGAVESILARHPGGRVAVVVPQPLDRILRAVVSGSAVGDLWDVADEGATVSRFVIDDDAPSRPAMAVLAGVFGGAAFRGATRGRFGVAQS